MKRAASAITIVIALAACKSKPDADKVTLSETYTTASKLATVHYPPTFTAAQAGEKVAVLTALPSSAYDPTIEIHFGTNDKPVTTVVDEYAKILHKTFQESHPDWKEDKRQAGTCFKGFAGIETIATFTNAKGKRVRYRSCTFLAGGHGFWLAYMDSEGAFAEDEPLLRKIVDATEIKL